MGSLRHQADNAAAHAKQRDPADRKHIDPAILRPDGAGAATPVPDRTRRIHGLRPAPVPAPRADCLHHIFERSADLHPESIALECGPRTWTYAELEASANRLACQLAGLGIRRGDLVGIALPRSHWPILVVLAVLKTGAGYVPLEPSLPDDRLEYIAAAAGLKLIVTQAAQRDRISARAPNVGILTVEEHEAAAGLQGTERLGDAAIGNDPSGVCYVLFTSGTTGRPKGVVTEHRNVVHFVGAFSAVCSTTPNDRVFQGFALGFDGSVEEMWMAFSNAATLVCAEQGSPTFGADLAALLADLRITFLSTVPTMLSTLTPSLPHLRQLVVSGEACPPDLVDRWCRPGLTMLNVYGPTEATVNSTAAVLSRGKRVTIGKPLPGYDIHILGPDRLPVPAGEKGELYIGGPGVSRGYLGQPELTSKSYIEWSPPSAPDASPLPPIRLYRTGDLVSLDSDGEIEFDGRIDTQVKLRGFRIELSEIEAVLVEDPAIGSAVVTVHDNGEHQSLAAFVLLAAGESSLDRSRLLERVRGRLPAYMIPATLDVVECFPLLVSGKVDRAQLPAPVAPLVRDNDTTVAFSNDLEERIAAIWAKVLQVPAVGAVQDFFLDLGGHSLKAAQAANAMRTELGLSVPIRSLYANPTVRALAAAMPSAATVAEQPATERIPQPARRPWTTVAAQALYLLAIVPLLALPLVYVIPLGIGALRQQASLVELVQTGLVVVLSTWLVLILTAIAAKWLLIGRYRPGRHPLWGGYFLRWWIVSRLQHLSGIGVFNGTPLAPVLWRLMGAKVGDRCVLNPALVYAWDCISIGWDVSIGADTHMPGLRIENGELVIGTLAIGDGCFVGCHAMLGLDVRMEPGAKLDDQSLLPDGVTLARDTSYRGSPARPASIDLPQGPVTRAGLVWIAIFGPVQLAAGLAVALLTALPIAVAAWALALAAVHWPFAYAAAALLVAIPVAMIVFALWAAFCKRLIAPTPRPGTYPVYSIAYLRYWLSGVVMQVIKTLGLPLFTTLYLPPWMRLLGARLGPRTEMSTVWSIDPSLLKAGEGVFFADGCMLGASRIHNGRFTLAVNQIGDYSFIGNSAILSTGVRVGDDCLLGVLSSTPDGACALPSGTDWLGSPGFRLPHRDKVTCFAREETFAPTFSLYLQRALIDGLRVLLPGYVLGAFAMTSTAVTLAVYDAYGVWGAYTAVPLMTWLLLVVCITTVVGLKWLIMGRFKPVVVPLWCRYVWWNELINGLYESLLAPIITNFFGTPVAPVLLRAMGCSIGRRCYVETALFSEFDLVRIGDDVALNAGVVIQNHLFEDRVMKSSFLDFGDSSTVGNMSVVLYDAVIGEQATLEPMSLLMKGETLPPASRWRGIPTAQVTGD